MKGLAAAIFLAVTLAACTASTKTAEETSPSEPRAEAPAEQPQAAVEPEGPAEREEIDDLIAGRTRIKSRSDVPALMQQFKAISAKAEYVGSDRNLDLQVHTILESAGHGLREEERVGELAVTETTEVYKWHADSAAVLVTRMGGGDDSVKGTRYCVEFVQKELGWSSTTVGLQVQCWQGRGHTEWSAENCR